MTLGSQAWILGPLYIAKILYNTCLPDMWAPRGLMSGFWLPEVLHGTVCAMYVISNHVCFSTEEHYSSLLFSTILLLVICLDNHPLQCCYWWISAARLRRMCFWFILFDQNLSWQVELSVEQVWFHLVSEKEVLKWSSKCSTCTFNHHIWDGFFQLLNLLRFSEY